MCFLVQYQAVYHGSLLSKADYQNVTLKKVNPIRWAERKDTVFILKVRFQDIQKALNKMILLISNSDEKI